VRKGLRFLLVAALAALVALPVAAMADVATHRDHHKVSRQDKMFMTDAAEGALFEVQAGALAARKGANPETRAFGRRMVRDHSRDYAELARLAHKLGVDIPDEPSEQQQQQAIALWKQLSGKAFDCAYIPYEVVDHMLDIEHNKTEVEQGSNPKVRRFAARWLPVLRSHLDQAEEVLADLHTC